MANIEAIGGWPKIISTEPGRPHELFGERHDDPENEPHDINFDASKKFGNTENVYAVMEIFISFHERGLYPPKWSLDYLAERFQKHMTDPDPDLLASQLGVTGLGSGSLNPHDEYMWREKRLPALEEMAILLGGFDISVIDAARFAIEKNRLSITPKRLTEAFRETFGSPTLFLRKNRGNEPWNDPFFDDAENRRDFLSGFSTNTRRFLKSKLPDKT